MTVKLVVVRCWVEWLDLTPGASWKLLNDAIEKTQDEFINESNSKPVYRMHIAENTKLNNVAGIFMYPMCM